MDGNYARVTLHCMGRVAQSVQRLATGWTVRGSNRGGGEIFRTCPDRPWGPPSLLYNGYRVFPGGKERPGRDANPSPPSSAVGHERVQLYLYSPYGPYGLYRASVQLYLYSPYGPYGLYRASVPVQGCTLPLLLHYIVDHQVVRAALGEVITEDVD